LKDVEYEFLGVTQEKTTIDFGNVGLDLVELCQKWQEPLEKVFPTATEPVSSTPKQYKFEKRNSIKPSVSIAKPRIFMPNSREPTVSMILPGLLKGRRGGGHARY